MEASTKEACLEGLTKQASLEDPRKEAFLEDSLKEVTKDAKEGEAERVVLKKDSSPEQGDANEAEGAAHEECGLADHGASSSRVLETAVKGIQRIVCNANVDMKGLEGNLFTEGPDKQHSVGMEAKRSEKNPKRRRKEKQEGEEASVEGETTSVDLAQLSKLRPRRNKTPKRENIVTAAQSTGRDLRLYSRKVNTRSMRGEVKLGITEEPLQQETVEPRRKRRRKVDQEGNIAAGLEENGNPEESSQGADDVRLVSKGKPGLGDKVMVSWEGSNYSCKVVAVKATMLKVHYSGWSDGYDQWVPIPSRPSPDAQPNAITRKGGNSAAAVKAQKKIEVVSKKSEVSRKSDLEEIAELLLRSSLDLEPLLPPTKVFEAFSYLLC